MVLLASGDPRRVQLALLCRQGKLRRVARQYPCDWHPGTVLNLRTGLPYSDPEAFEAIGFALAEPSIEVLVVTLRVPPNRDGYELLIPQGSGRPPIYIKVQLGPGIVLGRSFHYSDFSR